ncbi:hypothetical protein GALMADRAFT_252376 [Galerina marginata CBS 339.88]|uniref:Uncharacterized protein n=1 Tax=Galerina marginata (strain CBS 339.88) TaxID=685588 RepID=A0A067SQ54_GALM3|nr:hypothetical protein GALMADRAFT_252376 [Galerina marginata CBS 339.88]
MKVGNLSWEQSWASSWDASCALEHDLHPNLRNWPNFVVSTWNPSWGKVALL